MKYIKRISCDFEGYDEDENEYVTYDKKPFTGVLYEERGGVIISEESVIDGLKIGYVLFYHDNGHVEQIYEFDTNSIIGIQAKWDEDGDLVSAEKIWWGEVVEKMSIENGIRFHELVMTDQRKHEILTSSLSKMYHYRHESLQELLAEAEEKIRTGTVFDDPRLLT
jgi:antitoxin component YwqK of YwqJK toxin-antitoxin module